MRGRRRVPRPHDREETRRRRRSFDVLVRKKEATVRHLRRGSSRKKESRERETEGDDNFMHHGVHYGELGSALSMAGREMRQGSIPRLSAGRSGSGSG
jgi:hypothetical protein